ncbi:arginine--tRNA ligase [Candidatus Daviesbacteria bacterium RIFCSPLOWO2_02_FULL_36_7]|uniref:Arginine--tRNA ligase n=1 Tax=Candidatus Daviesbacteria bacterium RIFCSPLOWO2_02_FULL_36_7 TaxID=1797792 RepID=A0A1F5MI41_9BACT|nr:MAG: arginine--tRNA ligase [Candidatus Daviesbacteria bacterium RIFCSPLOWO2_02_FULL_36_7]
MLKQKILEDLKLAVKELGFPTSDIILSSSKNPAFGDYSTNVVLQLAKLKPENGKQSPQEIANKIVSNLSNLSYLNKVEVAGGGFINFFVKAENLANNLKEILERKESFGKSEIGKGKKARVEYISANPTGPLHIGNARGGPLGDTVANVLAFCSYEVLREYLDNNVGGQVEALGATVKAKYHGNLASQNQYQGEYINDLVKDLEVEIEGKSDLEIGGMAVSLIYEDIMADTHAMGIKFDLVVHESQLRKEAPEIIEELQKKGVVKEKDGALWLAPNDEFLKDRETVIKKSDGNYTYFTSDIVYHKQKFATGADLVINVWGSNHHGHISRMQAAIGALGFNPQKLKVILYQYVRVRRGIDIVKMSKRAGNFVTAREVLDEVGVDAFRFYLLRFSPQTHMDFDLELLKQQSNKNPVYYVQYAYVRMVNIIKKVNSTQFAVGSAANINYSLLSLKPELDLIKHLLNFPDLIEEIAANCQVQQLTEYAICLADLFHKFYENCPVLQAESGQLIQARLALVRAAKITLANVLKLLGVSAPERM